MTVYQDVANIVAELPAIGKDSVNTQQGYKFRGIETILEHLKPLLAKHGVFIVPTVLERVPATRQTKGGTNMYEVNLHVQFTFYGSEGDHFSASAWGEGTDMGDKATNKAMTGAFKSVLLQSFAIAGGEDADETSPEPSQRLSSVVTDKQIGHMKALMDKAGIDRDARGDFAQGIIGHKPQTWQRMTASEATRIIEALEDELNEGAQT